MVCGLVAMTGAATAPWAAGELVYVWQCLFHAHLQLSTAPCKQMLPKVQLLVAVPFPSGSPHRVHSGNCQASCACCEFRGYIAACMQGTATILGVLMLLDGLHALCCACSCVSTGTAHLLLLSCGCCPLLQRAHVEWCQMLQKKTYTSDQLLVCYRRCGGAGWFSRICQHRPLLQQLDTTCL